MRLRSWRTVAARRAGPPGQPSPFDAILGRDLRKLARSSGKIEGGAVEMASKRRGKPFPGPWAGQARARRAMIHK